MGALGNAALGIGMNVAAEAGNVIFGEVRQRQQLRGQKKALEQQNAAALELWEKTNYKAQMEQLEKAGLNPGLIYGMGGAGGQVGHSSAMPDSASGGLSGMGLMAGMMQAAQIKDLQASADLKSAQAENLRGVGKDVQLATIEKLKQEVKSEQARQALTEVETEIAKLDQIYQGDTLENRIAATNETTSIIYANVRKAVAESDITVATKEAVIRTVQLGVAEKLISLEAARQGINESQARIKLMSEQGRAMLAGIQQRWAEIEEGGKNRNVQEQRIALDREIAEFEKFVGLPAKFLENLLPATIIKGGIEKAAGKSKGYDRWGTQTKPGGYDLK